jgi:hypothetical protein
VWHKFTLFHSWFASIFKIFVLKIQNTERCFHREHKLIKLEKDRIARANAIVHRKKKIKEENIARDAILKSYAQFKHEAKEEAESLEEFSHDLAALDDMRQRRQFAHMDSDMATLLTDVALGSGSITLAKTIKTEIKNTELIRMELAETLSAAQKKNYHRVQLQSALERHYCRRKERYMSRDGQWTWGGPRGSSPRRASLEFRGAKMFQARWRGYAMRSVEHRATSVLSVVDERSHSGAQMFAATAMRMVAEKNKETVVQFFDGELGENARHIRLQAHNLRKFQAASRRLLLVEEDWKKRAAESRERNQLESMRVIEEGGSSRPVSRSTLRRRSSGAIANMNTGTEGAVGVEEALLEEGLALHKERAIVDAAIQYTAASIIQRFVRMIEVENGTYVPRKVKKEHDAYCDLRRNQSRDRVHRLWDLKEAKRFKYMIVGFTLFQQKIRHFLANSVVERSSKATIGRLVIRHKYNTEGKEILSALREQRREALCNAVSTTVITVRNRLIQIMGAWHGWAREQSERRAWLLGRDARRRALIIEAMLHAYVLTTNNTRTPCYRYITC